MANSRRAIPLIAALFGLASAAAGQPTTVNDKVVTFCKAHRDEKVGDGECTYLAEAAVEDAGAKPCAAFKEFPGRADFVWGELVYALEARDGSRKETKVPGMTLQPGDVVQFRDARFKGSNLRGFKDYDATFAHHTAVVLAVKKNDNVIVVLEENVNGKKQVVENPYRLSDLKAGWVRIYRPVSGWIEKLGGGINYDDEQPGKPVIEVDLRGTNVTDADLKGLKELEQLKELVLSQTAVTDAGLKVLKGLKRLTTLHLTGTKVTDAGLKDLEGLKELTTLYVGDTRVTDAGVRELKGALANCRVVTRPTANEKMVSFCKGRLGAKVGDGGCTNLAEAALRHAGAKPRTAFKEFPGRGDFVWGELVFALEVKDHSRRETKVPEMSVRPGDVVQFRDTRFKGENLRGFKDYDAAFPHHTAIVVAVRRNDNIIVVSEQLFDGKKQVVEAPYRLSDLKAGWVRIYRPVSE